MINSNDGDRLFLVGQYRSGDIPNTVWEFQGIYEEENDAVKSCRNERYFIMPVKVNMPLPDETMSLEEVEELGLSVYYPLAKCCNGGS